MNLDRAREIARLALRNLEANQQRIDDLNVYPVPDGDTGTNMALTLESVARSLDGRESMMALMERGDLFGEMGLLDGLPRDLRDDLAAAVVGSPIGRMLRAGIDVWDGHDPDPETILDADDVLGKRIVSTRLRGNVTIREAHATAALEVMSRFAANPKWLIYLPPTMSPSETSNLPML